MKHLQLVAFVVVGIVVPASAQQPTQPKPATEATKAANRAVQQYLDFNDKQDFAEFFGLLDTFPFWFNVVTP